MISSIPDDNNTLNTEVVVLLKSLTNFWRSLDLPLINCKIEFGLSWPAKCIISQIYGTPESLLIQMLTYLICLFSGPNLEN